jgi:hypothetical protein
VSPPPATASAEGAQLNGRPFPATASAEGRQFNGAPSLWERVRVRGFVPGSAGPLTPRPLPLGEGASGKVVFFELAIQCGQGDIQDAGGNLPIASMPLQRLHNSLSFNLGEGSIGR